MNVRRLLDLSERTPGVVVTLFNRSRPGDLERGLSVIGGPGAVKQRYRYPKETIKLDFSIVELFVYLAGENRMDFAKKVSITGL